MSEPHHLWLVDESTVTQDFLDDLARAHETGAIIVAPPNLRVIEVNLGRPSRVITFDGVSEAPEPEPEHATRIVVTQEGLKVI